MKTNKILASLLEEVRACHLCEEHLAHEVNPVLRAHQDARILVIGQAPGRKVHETGIPWNDPSGDRLRDWMGVTREQFYNERDIAIIPMGFCYPGKGRSGDLPPRKECAPQWHQGLLEQLPGIELTLLVGSYAQNYYLLKEKVTLTERVRNWQQYLPTYLPLVHPSPRNRYWLSNNPWFERELVPYLRERVTELL